MSNMSLLKKSLVLMGLMLLFSASVLAQGSPDLTTFGTVVSKSGDNVVIETKNGLATFQILDTTIVPEGLSVGDRIAVRHELDNDGIIEATEILLKNDVAETVVVQPMTETETETTVYETETVAAEVDVDTDMDMDVDTTAEIDFDEPEVETDVYTAEVDTTDEVQVVETRTYTQRSLPRTASPLPLLLLSGLAALGGGLTLRSRRK